MVIHGTEYPYWNQVSLNNTKLVSFPAAELTSENLKNLDAAGGGAGAVISPPQTLLLNGKQDDDNTATAESHDNPTDDNNSNSNANNPSKQPPRPQKVHAWKFWQKTQVWCQKMAN